jgi:predicted transcriptional regulator of viral defense system
MDRQLRATLNNLASDQGGLFSAAQAKAVGGGYAQLSRAERTGELRRVGRGIYSFAGLPVSMWETVTAVALRAGTAAVISHGTAAAVHRFEHGRSAGKEGCPLTGAVA